MKTTFRISLLLLATVTLNLSLPHPARGISPENSLTAPHEASDMGGRRSTAAPHFPAPVEPRPPGAEAGRNVLAEPDKMFHNLTARRDGLALPSKAAEPAAVGPRPSQLQPTQLAKLNATPRGFIPNVGQVRNESVKFALRDRGVTAYFDEQGFVLWNGQTTSVTRDGVETKVPVAPRWSIVDAKPVQPVGGEAFPHTVSFFQGNDPTKWQANVPAYRDLRYPEILSGVELRVESRERGFEYTFHVQPHARPDLRFRYDGITGLEKSLTGDLIVRAATGHFTESRPVSFQWIDGERREVESRFEIVSAREYRIALGNYDERHELVIDPVLDWSTSIGGSYGDQINVIKVDPFGNVIVAGVSHSVNLPTTAGFAPFGTDAGENFGSDPQWPQHSDVYVAKFSADGTQLLWAGYLGGEGPHPESTGRNKPLAIDAAGDVYITTHTQSPDFPVLPFGSSFHQGGTDASITKIMADGSAIIWSRLLGAQAEDHGYAVAVYGNDLYLSGVTTSPNFPVTLAPLPGCRTHLSRSSMRLTGPSPGLRSWAAAWRNAFRHSPRTRAA